MRYRLSTLLIAMVWVGLVCVALRAPSQWWSGGMFALLVLLLLIAVLMAIYRTGQLRAMAIGFLIFSLGFLAVQQGYWPAGGPGMRLPTDNLVDWSFAVLHFNIQGVNLDPDAFQRVIAYKGICINSLATVVGVIGGIIAQALCCTRPAERQPTV